MDRQALVRIHAEYPEWGSGGAKWAKGIVSLIDTTGARSVLDYGAGKGFLGQAVRDLKPEIEWADYDPAFTDRILDVSDVVVCTHVLEHAEDVEKTIRELHSLTRKALFVSVGSGEGRVWAPNRNVHAPQWWAGRLSRHFHQIRPVCRRKFQQGRIKSGMQKDYLTAVCWA